MVLDQIAEDQPFVSTGEIKIKDLTFFSKDGTNDVLDVRAKSLAMQIDKVFTMIRGASYEENMSRLTAVTALVEVLKDGEKSIAELADTADDQYLFFQEGE